MQTLFKDIYIIFKTKVNFCLINIFSKYKYTYGRIGSLSQYKNAQFFLGERNKKKL